MSKIRTESRNMLASMTGDKDNNQDKTTASVARVEEASVTEEEQEFLPDHLRLYLKSLAPNLSEYITDLMLELIDWLEEKEAARKLWGLFGLPRSPLAVPVFKMLSEKLGSAQDEVQQKSLESQSFINRVEQALRGVFLFYSLQLFNLEKEEAETEQAVEQLKTVDARGSKMLETTDQSTEIFIKRKDELAKEKAATKKAHLRWEAFAVSLTEKLPMLRRFEAPIDLGAPDPKMALPA